MSSLLFPQHILENLRFRIGDTGTPFGQGEEQDVEYVFEDYELDRILNECLEQHDMYYAPDTVPSEEIDALLTLAHSKIALILMSDNAKYYSLYAPELRIDKSERVNNYNLLRRELLDEYKRICLLNGFGPYRKREVPIQRYSYRTGGSVPRKYSEAIRVPSVKYEEGEYCVKIFWQPVYDTSFVWYALYRTPPDKFSGTLLWKSGYRSKTSVMYDSSDFVDGYYRLAILSDSGIISWGEATEIVLNV